MPVLVSNLQQKVSVSNEQEGLVMKTVNMVLEEEDSGKESEVSVVFVDDVRMQELNKQYRGVGRPTDVLSFAMTEGEDFPGGEEELLGDVVISLETAVNQAEEYGHSVDREVAYLTVHGVLHLLGYDHEDSQSKKIMRQKEEAIMNKVNLSR